MKDMVQIKRAQRQQYKGPDAKIGRSQFDRSHGIKTAFDASRLVPIFIDEILPGDTMTCSLNGFCRIFSPLDAPVMDNIELDTSFFFVPTRLLWDKWEDFNGAHVDAGAQDTDYTIPIMATGLTINHDNGVLAEDLGAYFGLPDGLQTGVVPVSALPWRAYNLIYNNWFRDQNLQGVANVQQGNGPDTTAQYVVRKSAKKHDYFTSALPYLQKGTAISVSLLGSAEIKTAADVGTDISIVDDGTSLYVKLDSDGSFVDLSATTGVAGDVLYADLTSATGMSINALRQSVAIQRLLERDARGGTRYTEILKSHFGVTSPDFRLQRAEYLGGGKAFVNISPVANTSSTAGEDQGELRGIGTGVINGHSWSKSFVEHGYVIGLIRARGDLTYFQGLDRMWSRSTRYDFYIPALANLGEQSILNKELWISNVLATDDGIFGYQQRWEEYRTKKSMITNVMNPDAAAALSFWHLAEDFATLPALNMTFMEDQTPMIRVTTVDTQPDFLLDLWFNYKCARPIPIYSIPALTSGRF